MKIAEMKSKIEEVFGLLSDCGVKLVEGNRAFGVLQCMTWLGNHPHMFFAIIFSSKCQSCKQPNGDRFPVFPSHPLVKTWGALRNFRLIVRSVSWLTIGKSHAKSLSMA